MADSDSTLMQRYAEFLARKRDRMERHVYIYVLLDPFTEEIRYVGKSIRPMERLANHCNEKSVTWRTNWIRSVLATGRRPLLRILEILDRDDDWRAAECRWIAHLKEQGARLTNCTSGGDGVSGLPAEIRAKMALTWTGRKHRPETLAKLSIASRGRKHSEASRAHMRQLMTGRVVTWNDKLRHAIERLTAEQVLAIRWALKNGANQYTLAARFHVHQGTICNIKRGVCYRWVKDMKPCIVKDCPALATVGEHCAAHATNASKVPHRKESAENHLRALRRRNRSRRMAEIRCVERRSDSRGVSMREEIGSYQRIGPWQFRRVRERVKHAPAVVW